MISNDKHQLMVLKSLKCTVYNICDICRHGGLEMNNIGEITVKMVMKWLDFTRYATNNEKSTLCGYGGPVRTWKKGKKYIF